MLDLTHAFLYNADRRLSEIAACKRKMQKMNRTHPEPTVSWTYHSWLQLYVINAKVESKYFHLNHMHIIYCIWYAKRTTKVIISNLNVKTGGVQLVWLQKIPNTKLVPLLTGTTLFVKKFNLSQKRFKIMKIPGMILARSTKSVLIVVIAAPAVDVLAYFASVSRMTMMVTTMLMVTQMTTNLPLSLIDI